MAVQIQLRNDTSTNWTSYNPTLAQGELGIETDTQKYKLGDGATAWTSLSYATLSAGTFNNTIFGGITRESVYTTATGFAGYTFYATTNNSIQYITANSTANGTLNITSTSSQTLNTLMSIGQSITCILLVTNGSTAYYPNAIQIDGTSVTPKWISGLAVSSGNASSIDAYSFNIIKTANATFTVLAQQSKFA
jgi:hypothetical protein